MISSSSGFSLYEFLGIFMPGVIILACLLFYFQSPTSLYGLYSGGCCNTTAVLTAWQAFSKEFMIAGAIAISFTFGLLLNVFADVVFRGFRNIPELIESTAIAQRNFWGEKYPDIVTEQHFTDNGSQALSLFHSIYVTFINILKLPFTCSKKYNLKNSLNIKYYYKAYYRIMQSNLLGNIPRLEAQVNFLRNMTLLSIFLMFFSCYRPCFAIPWWTYLLFSIACFIVMVQRQNKIYSLVWEGDIFTEISMKNS